MVAAHSSGVTGATHAGMRPRGSRAASKYVRRWPEPEAADLRDAAEQIVSDVAAAEVAAPRQGRTSTPFQKATCSRILRTHGNGWR
jgi:hypothetical protein